MQYYYLENILKNLRQKNISSSIFVPGLWLNLPDGNPVKVDFRKFLISQISDILKAPTSQPYKSKGWTNNAVVYNLFIRLFSAYDHNQDGKSVV